MNVELFYAIHANNLNRVTELIFRGVDVNLPEKFGRTPLMLAVERKGSLYNIEIVNALTLAGANVNYQDNYGNTVLHDLLYDEIWNLESLREEEQNHVYNEEEEQNEEVRIYFTQTKQFIIKKLEDVLTILLENNANPYLKNNKGETIFDIAKGNIQIINSINKIIRDVNRDKKRIATDAYMRSRNKPYLPPTNEHPLSGFYHSNIDDPDNIMEQVLNMAYGEDKDEEENEGEEESKSNRGDAGGKRRKSKSKTRKSGGRRRKSKSKTRKSGGRRRKSKSKTRKSGGRRRKSKSKTRKSGGRRRKSKSKTRKSGGRKKSRSKRRKSSRK